MKRYRPPTSLMTGAAEMIESPDGEWVRFIDVKYQLEGANQNASRAMQGWTRDVERIQKFFLALGRQADPIYAITKMIEVLELVLDGQKED